MKSLSFDYAATQDFISNHEMEMITPFTQFATQQLLDGKGPGNEFTGWIDLPFNYDKDEFQRVKSAADKIRSHSDILIVVGIGGSY
ncbi:MAG: hypothetical protein KDC24_06235, partial [Saprospiraceae bacterium]|nr:hypothetical protein [Saprospiraceae bacterium]